MTNFQKWMNQYKIELEYAVEHYPKMYIWPKNEIDKVVANMEQAFKRGSYNKDSVAIKRCCRFFGLKHTYKAINTFIGDK